VNKDTQLEGAQRGHISAKTGLGAHRHTQTDKIEKQYNHQFHSVHLADIIIGLLSASL